MSLSEKCVKLLLGEEQNKFRKALKETKRIGIEDYKSISAVYRFTSQVKNFTEELTQSRAAMVVTAPPP